MKKKKDLKPTVVDAWKSYHIFYRRPHDSMWVYQGAFDYKTQAEEAMHQHGEPEGIEYKIIKGVELEYEDAPPIYPYFIKEE